MSMDKGCSQEAYHYVTLWLISPSPSLSLCLSVYHVLVLFVCPIISSFVRETSYILGTYVTTHGCYLIIVELVYTVV